ncbi:uncharacterized protein LOC133188574 [Saccostrea echinata]|uniref:uncharacterized protein LOC133188574 n=1 Tax=Saccostrea echinata TaxID=191078 RepID=UPI002A7F83CF|nr:uncharacterized protein LOC133188574 [Saccostrea echinata]
MFQLLVLTTLALAAVCFGQMLEELKKLDISPENIEGVEQYTDLTIDEIITQALGGIDLAAQKMITPGGNILAELDMNLTEEQYQLFYSAPEFGSLEMMPYFEQKRKKRKAVRRTDLRWTDGVMPYTFANGHFTTKELYIMKTAMREWEKYTCIKFREKTSSDVNFVRIQNGHGCNSQLGMVGGEQILNLDINGCRWKGLYLHEIGHAIGLVHEHQLPNRDDYIDIIFANVAPSMRVWFQKYRTREVNQYDVNYELTSVMHYGTTAFSADGRSTTIRPKNKTSTDIIGKVWKKELAFSDVKAVNRMYECAAHCPKTIKCIRGGFVDQNCKCICPDGSDECTAPSPGEKLKTDRRSDCVNTYNDWQCHVWATQGECDINPDFMKVSCKRACRVCGHEEDEAGENHVAAWSWQWFGLFANLFPGDWAMSDCVDHFKNDKCQEWAKNGDCITNANWMGRFCKKSCGKCSSGPKKTPSKNCVNIEGDKGCNKWAMKGECITKKTWMQKNCRKACQLCEAADETDDDVDDNDTENRPRNRDDDDDVVIGCRDKHNSQECAGWAKRDECRRNPKWMIPNCRASCGRCKDGGCKNLYDDKKCKYWAKERECFKNPSWMRKNCAESCNSCEELDGSYDTNNNDNDDKNTRNNDFDKTNEDDIEVHVNDGEATTRRPRQKYEDDDDEDDDPNCSNTHNNRDCTTWAKYGHCEINPSYMSKMCQKACNKCKIGTREDTNERARDPKVDDKEQRDESYDASTTTEKTPRQATCEDFSESCPSWAKTGVCNTNPVYALVQCKKSCNNCKQVCTDQHTLCKLWAKSNHCNSNAAYMLRYCHKSCKVC